MTDQYINPSNTSSNLTRAEGVLYKVEMAEGLVRLHQQLTT